MVETICSSRPCGSDASVPRPLASCAAGRRSRRCGIGVSRKQSSWSAVLRIAWTREPKLTPPRRLGSDHRGKFGGSGHPGPAAACLSRLAAQRRRRIAEPTFLSDKRT
eukprot:365725-Chlamydomonas_euryale.AAC.25